MFEIKDTEKSNEKRLIIYTEKEGFEQTIGLKLNKKELYDLYTTVRDSLKKIDKTLVKA